MRRHRGPIVALLILLAGWSDSHAQTATWTIRYSTGVSLNPGRPGEEFSFNFPLAPGSVHYITKPVTRAAGVAARASFSLTTGGDPVFDYRTAPNNTCDKPAAVRLFLQRQGDDMTGKGDFEFYRWWSTAGTVLKAGSVTVDVPLDPALWTSVFGKAGDKNPAAFADAVAHLGNVGVTFGGGCFFGHGVRVLRGGAEFTMHRFAVE